MPPSSMLDFCRRSSLSYRDSKLLRGPLSPSHLLSSHPSCPDLACMFKLSTIQQEIQSKSFLTSLISLLVILCVPNLSVTYNQKGLCPTKKEPVAKRWLCKNGPTFEHRIITAGICLLLSVWLRGRTWLNLFVATISSPLFLFDEKQLLILTQCRLWLHLI